MRFSNIIEDKSKNIIIQNNLSIARFSINAKQDSINILSIIFLRKLHRNINNVKKSRRFRFRDRFF